MEEEDAGPPGMIHGMSKAVGRMVIFIIYVFPNSTLMSCNDILMVAMVGDDVRVTDGG